MKFMSRLAAAFALLLILSSPLSTVFAQGTAFTYQGQMFDGTHPATGKYDLTFALFYDGNAVSQAGSTITNSATSVTNGLFTVILDFGSGIFTGSPLWLEIAVRTNGGAGVFTPLTPLQQLTPAPYAVYASSATAAIYADGVTAGSVTGAGIASGQVVKSLNGLKDAVILSSGANITVTPSGNTLTIAASGGGTGTPTNIPSTIVGRDASGSFASQSITLAGNLGMPTTASSSIGVLNLGGVPFLHGYGNQNIFVGPGAGNFTMSGVDDTAIGYDALAANTTGNNNTASGVLALFFNMTGNDNTADGYEALFFNTGGTNNTANGFKALFNAGGNDNIALGFQAGMNVSGGNNNIEIGNQGASGDDGTILVGTQGIQTNTFIAGIYGATAASGVAVYANANGQLGTLTSSARFKQDIHSMDDASDVLLSLRPVTFKYKPNLDPQGLAQFGLVAEEVEKIDPDLVAHDDQGKIYTVRYEAVNAMLLNEFLKQHRKMAEQNSKMAEQKNELEQLKQSLAEVKAMVTQLAQMKAK